MSGRLVSRVFESALPAWLKPYAAAFATFANDDGSSVRPSLALVARMVGRSLRSAQKATSELRRRRVLQLVAPSGRARTCRYHFNESALAQAGDGEQILFSFGDQRFPQRKPKKAAGNTRFPQFPQQLTGTLRRGIPEADDGRSFSDPSLSTRTRARAR